MGSVLNPQLFLLEDLFAEETTKVEQPKVSIWMKDKDIFKASTDVTLVKAIEPGIYTAGFDKNIGYFCKKLHTSSDELFIFSDSITQKLVDEIKLFWDKAQLYKENNLIHKRGILLEGYPGVGKSSIISILSLEIIEQGGVVFRVSDSSNLGDYIEFIRGSFRKLQPDTPIITILEDIDQYDDVSEELLDFLDGKTHINHHVVIATTNNTSEIPDTFLRPSRLDLKIEIPLPSKTVRGEYFKFKNVPDEDIDNLVEQSNNLSLADLKELYICIYLLDYSVENAVAKITSPREKRNYLTSPRNKSRMGF